MKKWTLAIGIFFLIGGIGNLGNNFGAFLFGVAVGGLLIFFSLKKKKPSEAPATPSQPLSHTASSPTTADEEPQTVVKAYEVAGVSYYLNNLLSMSEPNYLYEYKKQDLIDTCNYDISIYKNAINATQLNLVHEEDNPHDPNAIMVLLNDKLVGYIAAKDCKHILEIMDNDLFVSATCEVYGGKYKRVNEDYNWEKDKSTYSMETGEDPYGITIHIREKVLK